MYLQAEQKTAWFLSRWLGKKPADLDLQFSNKSRFRVNTYVISTNLSRIYLYGTAHESLILITNTVKHIFGGYFLFGAIGGKN